MMQWAASSPVGDGYKCVCVRIMYDNVVDDDDEEEDDSCVKNWEGL